MRSAEVPRGGLVISRWRSRLCIWLVCFEVFCVGCSFSLHPTDERRVVLLGKTGSGKSSLLNTIFGGGNVFPVNHSPNSGIWTCRSATGTVYGRKLTLIDTPELIDTDPNMSPVSSKIMNCLEQLGPGAHAFLLVLKVDNTQQNVVNLMLKFFPPEALKYTTVVFTHGDNLPSGMSISEWAQQNTALRDLLRRCGNRYYLVDNRRWSNSQWSFWAKQNRIQDLLDTIDQTVAANGGSYYPIKMLQNKGWIGVILAVMLVVAGVGVLLNMNIPWPQAIRWVIEGAKYRAPWIWARAGPAEKNGPGLLGLNRPANPPPPPSPSPIWRNYMEMQGDVHKTS